MAKKNKTKGIDITQVLWIIGFLCLIFTFYIVFRVSISDRKLWSVSFIALFLGLILESYRLCKSWKQILRQSALAYILSFTAFFPFKREKIYKFENHIEAMPYVFLLWYIIIFIFSNEKKVTAKLTEGITLMMSIAFIYWLMDYGVLGFENWYNVLITIIVSSFSIFALMNGLLKIKLTKNNRLWLSIWTSIITFVIGIDNIILVYKQGDFEVNQLFYKHFFIGLQYFLLGMSSVYMVRNFLMLCGFFPDKNEKYRKTLKETIDEHTARYSRHQVATIDAIFCIMFSGGLFYLNYTMDFLPRNMMIWLVIILFPLILSLLNHWKK